MDDNPDTLIQEEAYEREASWKLRAVRNETLRLVLCQHPTPEEEAKRLESAPKGRPDPNMGPTGEPCLCTSAQRSYM
jgi:hypothetical protein